MAKKQTVAIIGVGLIGGSLGLAFRKNSEYEVIGVGRNEEKLKIAVERGAIDRATTDLKEGVSKADFVFVATPVSKIVDLVKLITPYLKSGTIVTDVGSTKTHIVNSIEDFLPKEVHFIGGHPMAGSEQQGVIAARADLLKNAFYILTPSPQTNTNAFRSLHSLLAKTGAQVIAIDPEKHDKIVATISHLPHVLASNLVNLADEQTREVENLLLFAAGSFRDMTRISASDPEMWADICFENAKAVLKSLEEFQQKTQEIIELLVKGDRSALVGRLHEAQTVRASMSVALEKEEKALREISIPVADKPGTISDITVAVGDLGINIENIEVIPVTKTSGIIRLIVSGEKNAEKVLAMLVKRGYEASVSTPYKE